MVTKQLVGAGLVLVLAGCGAQPTAVKAPAEPEKRLSMAKGKATASAQAAAPQATRGAAPGLVGGNTAAAAPVASAAPAASSAAAPAAAARLMLIAPPEAPLTLMTLRGPRGEAVDVLSDPEDGLAGFVVQAPTSGLLVSKAKVEVQAGDRRATLELSHEELEWPAKVAGRVKLGVPLRLYETLQVLSQAPDATRVTFRATLFAPDGAPILAPDGEPLVLETTASVF